MKIQVKKEETFWMADIHKQCMHTLWPIENNLKNYNFDNMGNIFIFYS